jgi:hypothetical protein
MGNASPYQPSSFSEWLGNLGNNWAGGSDAPMYASPQATMANPGGATASGAYNAGQATAGAAVYAFNAVAQPVTGFASGLIQGAGIWIGLGIIVYTLAQAAND